MANAERFDGQNWVDFVDLGDFKDTKCEDIMGVPVCEVTFSEGRVVLRKEELDKILHSL